MARENFEQPLDAVIRITTANICGSDLHPYEGRAPLDVGMVLGHENMGVVEEIGAGVDRISVGDRVSVPFNLACGTCRNCTAGWTCACLRANPNDFTMLSDIFPTGYHGTELAHVGPGTRWRSLARVRSG